MRKTQSLECNEYELLKTIDMQERNNWWKVDGDILKMAIMAMLFSFVFSFSYLMAQESLNATGGNASGGGGSVSYSIGQVFYTINTGTDGSVAQGVQQPFEISVVTGLEEAIGINLSVTTYPNPTTDCLTLRIDEFEISNLSYQLYNVQGKLLQSEIISGSQTSIVMSNLVPAIYFVKVIVKTQDIASQQEVKTFKIIKN